MFVTDRERTMGASTIVVRDTNFGGREDRVSREDAVLASETQEREGERQGGVGREPMRRGEEVGPDEVGGGERDGTLML